MNKLLITIDGPAGAGKTTVSKMLADRLGYIYVDTGALYRGVALEAIEKGVLATDDESLNAMCKNLDLNLVAGKKGLCLMSGGKDITGRIRSPEVTMMASSVSARPVIRKFLLDIQRQMGKKKCAVFEGRDMGTVVFPDADVKFYLNASPRIRAMRRFLETKDQSSQTIDEIETDINKRDKNDSTRGISPLKPADDAILIDSTEINAHEVVEEMIRMIKSV
jgi:cytidylate kinase